MPSPFPGMNPYFEAPAIWEDFHQSLADEIRNQLTPHLRPKYYAALTPRVTYEEVLIQAKAQDVKPDVGVWRQSPSKPLPNEPYFVFLWRAFDPHSLGIWPLKLREPIPLLPVPLLDPDPAVPLDLTLAIHTIYDRAGYDMRIDYTQSPPKPDFSVEDAQWLQDLVATT